MKRSTKILITVVAIVVVFDVAITALGGGKSLSAQAKSVVQQTGCSNIFVTRMGDGGAGVSSCDFADTTSVTIWMYKDDNARDDALRANPSPDKDGGVAVVGERYIAWVWPPDPNGTGINRTWGAETPATVAQALGVPAPS